VKSRFWTTFVAPKVAKGAERPKWAERYEIFCSVIAPVCEDRSFFV